MPYAHNSDVTLYYEIKGTGSEILVLIHGLSDNLVSWSPWFIEKLHKHFKLLIVDLRGGGKSDTPPGPWSIAMMAKDVKAILEAEQIKKAHFFGFSLGGMVLLYFALEYPQYLNKVIVASTTAGGEKARIEGSTVIDETMKRLTGVLDKDVLISASASYSDEYIANNQEYLINRAKRVLNHGGVPPEGLKLRYEAGKRHDVRDRIQNLNVPCLVLYGDSDRLIRPWNSEYLIENIPNVQFKSYHGLQHSITEQEPEMTAEDIIAFLQS